MPCTPLPYPMKCPWCSGRAVVWSPFKMGGNANGVRAFICGCSSMECGADGPVRRTQRGAIEAWGEMAVAVTLLRASGEFEVFGGSGEEVLDGRAN